MEAKDYAVRVAALLAALPLTRSATYANLPEVVGCDALAEPDADVDAGKLIIVPGREGYRLGRAVNSLTTLTPDKAAPFQKIKIVEGIDLIRGDIAKAFESGYVGKVLNDYDNKLLLVTAINAYLKGLEGRCAGQDRRQPVLCVSVRAEKLSGIQRDRHLRDEGHRHSEGQHRQSGVFGGQADFLRRHGGSGAGHLHVTIGRT